MNTTFLFFFRPSLRKVFRWYNSRFCIKLLKIGAEQIVQTMNGIIEQALPVECSAPH